jgi:hypothetical protein
MSFKCFFPLVLLLACAGTPGFGQSAIPATDDDLAAVSDNLDKLTEMADECALTDGPKIDCAKCQSFFVNVRDARAYIQHLDYWLSYATQLKKNNFLASLDDKNRGLYKAILDVQSAVVDGGTYQQLVKSLKKNLGNLKNCYDHANEISLPQFETAIIKLTASLNRMQAAEGAFLGALEVSQAIPELEGGFLQDDFTDLVNALTEIKQRTYADHRDGNHWRKALQDKDHLKTMTDNVERLSSLYTDEVAATRQSQIDNLLAADTGLDEAQKTAYVDVKRFNARREKAARVFEHMEFLLRVNTITGSGRLTDCYLKLNDQCGVLDLNYVSRLEMPANIKVEDFKVSPELSGEDNSWVEPLAALDGKMTDVAAMLTGAPELGQIEIVASLTTDATQVKARQPVKIKFVSMFHFHPNSWVGFVPSDVPHGLEGNNAANVKGKRFFLRHMESGEFELKAPKEPGKYDLRMNDISSGREVASVSIEVVADETP